MPDTIVDSKFRILEPLQKVAGRSRYLASDLVRSEVAILEHVSLEGWDRIAERWGEQWQPALRERAARFSARAGFVPVLAVGAWNDGPYYVYASSKLPSQARVEAQDHRPDNALDRFPTATEVAALLEDIAFANDRGDQVLNVRPEHLVHDGDRLRILPGAYVLPIDLLARAGVRSPYQPPELRFAGLFGPTTDGYSLASVLSVLAERTGEPAPPWLALLQRGSTLEPGLRPTASMLAEWLRSPNGNLAAAEPLRRGVERLVDLRRDGTLLGRAPALLDAIDAAVTQLAEGRSTVLVVEGPENGGGLHVLAVQMREALALLNERPRVVEIDMLASWEARDLAGGGIVAIVPDWRPAGTELLPVERLLADKLRPFVLVVGRRRGIELPADFAAGTDAIAWLEHTAGADVTVRTIELGPTASLAPQPPESPAARHLLDLACVLEADPTAVMLRQALPQHESLLPETMVELERLGYARRHLDAGGWWGTEPQLVLRMLRPEALEQRRDALSPERREELHLLISHLLDGAAARTLGQRSLRFHHLFAGGNWEAAATECEPLLKGVQRRGLDALARQIQRRLVNSNLAQHVSLPRLLDLLRDLAIWETAHGRLAEGQRYFERAVERIFTLADAEAADLDPTAVTEMVLAYADLLERRAGFGRAEEMVQRYLERFGERLPGLERGRLFAELAYCAMRLGRFTEAEERCQVALKLLDARRNPKDVAQIYNVLGTVRWKTSRYDEAEQYFSTCMTLREKTGDKLAMSRIYNNLGLLYRSMRRFPDALEYHHRSMLIRQELGDADGVLRNIYNLAWVHFEMSNLDHAEDLAQRACDMSATHGNAAVHAQAKGLLGEICLARDRIPEARAALEEAVGELRQLGDVAELFANLRKSASLELRCDRIDRAEALLQEAERYLPSAASPLEEANWHLATAMLRERQGDPRRAAQSYEHAGNNLARLGNAPRAAEMFMASASHYQASGVEPRARDLVERARQLYGRDPTTVLPKELLDLEVRLGGSEIAGAGTPRADRFVEVLCRAAATASGAGSEVQALEQILSEMRALAGCRHAVLLGTDGLPHRASAIVREASVAPPHVLENQRLANRALQTVLPFGSEDMREEKPPRPFHVIPLEARERSLGCVYLEWDAGVQSAGEPVLPVLRALAQQLAIVLDRTDGMVPRARPAAEVAAPPVPATADETGLESLIGRSAARQAVIDFIRQVRDSDATVLVMGENGTGKEVVSRAIHATGTRRAAPFVTVNCTAIPEALWEREAFGHERGAFTDAHETKKGFFETAHRGTLLLDEIGDMPWEMQTKFLRVLEEKSFNHIGGTAPIRVDVRIIAATNQDLEAAVAAGRFRRDLFHRLNVLPITLRPLRERREDIPELARYFLDVHATRMGVRPKRLSGEALRILMRYPWPGNVRELENAMKGSLVLSDREVLLPEDLPAAVLRGGDASETAGELDIDSVAKWVLDHGAYSTRVPLMPALEKALARQLVAKLGEKTMAARLLGISKPTLYVRLK